MSIIHHVLKKAHLDATRMKCKQMIQVVIKMCTSEQDLLKPRHFPLAKGLVQRL